MQTRSHKIADLTKRKNYLFYSALINTAISGDFDYEPKGYKILNKIESNEDIDPVLVHQKTIHQVGVITLFKLSESIVLYTETDTLSDIKKVVLLSNLSSYLTNIVFCLWFTKDCSSNIEFTLNIDLLENDCSIFRGSNLFTNTSGLMSTETFSKDEWISAESYSEKLLGIGTTKKDKKQHSDFITNGFSPSGFNFADYNSTNRIERAFEFLRTARSSPIIAAKISFYVLILETLFSGGDSGELSYKLSQRIAGFLEPDYTKRKDIFKKVGKYYLFRSRHLHGQSLPGEYRFRDDLIKLSVEVDGIVRQIFVKILNNPEPFLQENGELFRAYLDSLIYS